MPLRLECSITARKTEKKGLKGRKKYCVFFANGWVVFHESNWSICPYSSALPILTFLNLRAIFLITSSYTSCWKWHESRDLVNLKISMLQHFFMSLITDQKKHRLKSLILPLLCKVSSPSPSLLINSSFCLWIILPLWDTAFTPWCGKVGSCLVLFIFCLYLDILFL